MCQADLRRSVFVEVDSVLILWRQFSKIDVNDWSVWSDPIRFSLLTKSKKYKCTLISVLSKSEIRNWIILHVFYFVKDHFFKIDKIWFWRTYLTFFQICFLTIRHDKKINRKYIWVDHVKVFLELSLVVPRTSAIAQCQRAVETVFAYGCWWEMVISIDRHG